MATILSALTKFAPGRVADVPAFSKAMSKLASYRQSHKYEEVLRRLIAEGLISIETGDKHEKKVVETEKNDPPPEMAAAPGPIAPIQVEEESSQEPQAIVNESPAEEAKVPTKKKR
jgi:hypothetical protein